MELRSSARCSICFERCNNSVTPDTCQHAFCLPCLTTWARQAGSCPVCRAPATSIQTRDGCTAVPRAAQVSVRILSHVGGYVLDVLSVHSSWTMEAMMSILIRETHTKARAILAQSMPCMQ